MCLQEHTETIKKATRRKLGTWVEKGEGRKPGAQHSPKFLLAMMRAVVLQHSYSIVADCSYYREYIVPSIVF